jgi:hypothetical protein
MKLSPLPYFLGCGLGLLILSWFGAEVQSSRMAREFVRFHRSINVETDYFPTARQVRAIIEQSRQATPKVFVIVGGSSVFHGVGQPADLVWTRFLQEELGPDYQVINFAQRAGTAADFGNIAAELLLLQSRPVIFVGDASTANYTLPLQNSFYRHIIFDAWHRGYLLPWPPRDRLLSEAAWRGPKELRAPALGSILDAALNFNDLWNFVGYEFANSNWNWLLNSISFEPRSSFQDLSPTVEQFASMRYSGDVDSVLRVVRSEMISPADLHWDRMIRLTEQMVPRDLRAVTLATVDLASPYYLNRLAPTERNAFMAQAYAQMQRLQELGFNRVVMAAKDFTEDDYIDRVHLAVSGGQKLATILAPTIRQMATELKYLP